ncbi:ABC transporter permease [Symbiobacterium terraclitae]|jgi:ABC-2 type transport system permease protein|uniref:ABC transporter permease n=1 Tax=Symbiobacterium terraclitae TaxID=557451 RepID=UPI0035B51F11
MIAHAAPGRRVWRIARKYAEVCRIALRSAWAYVWNQLLSTLFLVVVLYVFVQLWRVTFAAQGAVIDGYTLPEMIWYLVATEAIILSFPRVHAVLEQEVKGGDLALRLSKPYAYLGFHYATFLGEALVKLAVMLLVGGTTARLMVGPIPFRWEAAPVLLLLYLTTHALNFFYIAAVGLLAFWVEEVIGLHLLFDKLKWILGGMLIPVQLYPEAVRRLVDWLPFRHMIGGPAELFVHFSWSGAAELLLNQALWLAVFGLVCAGIYRRGVRRVDLNGG